MQKICIPKLQSLWGCIIGGVALIIPGLLIGTMIGVQGGAPLGALLGAKLGSKIVITIGYFGMPIIILFLSVSIFFIIGANIGNLIGSFITKLIDMNKKQAGR